MAISKKALRVTELDHDTIKENLKEYLRGQSEFTDFDFEGSGMSILLDILAYNTHYMGYYLNMVSNEMFMDTAQLRASVLSHAKHITYTPASRQGAVATINVHVTPSETEDVSAAMVTLEKYTRILGSDIDGVNYPFVALYSNTVSRQANTYTFSNIKIKQGEVVTLQYPMESSNETRKFEIPSANVDVDTISIRVQASASNTDTVFYTRSEDITEVDANSTVYFIEENENLNYTFQFGDNVLGKKPEDGSIIICTYLDTVGTQANGITKFVFSEPIAGAYRDNVVISLVSSSEGGVEKETIEQIRYRAPYAYTAQNRGVIDTDYKSLILKNFNNIDAVSVWGGEENDPPVYGKVYFSLKTKNNYFLSELEKERIKDELIRKYNVMTVTPEIVDPDYVYLVIKVKVYYDPKLTSKTANELSALVRAAISDYNDQELNSFDSTFKKFKLQSYIEAADKSITGSDLSVFVQFRLPLMVGSKDTYVVNFNMPLTKGELARKISTFPEITVNDSQGVARQVFFEEVPESLTGIEYIAITNPGREYQVAPTVTITGDGSGATAEAYIINGKVSKITLKSKGSNYTRATVVISGGGGTEASATAQVETNTGTLRSFYYLSNGEKVVVNNNAGDIDYSTGKITLNELIPIEVSENDIYEDDVLAIDAIPQNQVIPPNKNRILTIDDNISTSIIIDMVVSG